MNTQSYTPTDRLSGYFAEIEAEQQAELARSQRVMESFTYPEEKTWPVAFSVGLVLGVVLVGVLLGAVCQEATRVSPPKVQRRPCAALR